MGWLLLACFGSANKRKRPKTPHSFLTRTRSYQPLESDVLQSSMLRENTNEEAKNATRIKKRVRFNLEVTTYELLTTEDDVITNSLDYEVGLAKPSLYASDHRYNNSYSDKDECLDDIEDELSDLSDEEIDDNEYQHEEYQHIISVPLSSSDDRELVAGNGCKTNTRFRSRYIVPVLNPIENISQWKAVKARRN